jgi:Rad3-related DNA helicase
MEPIIGDVMGRLTQAARASFQDHLNNMRTEYREALVSTGRREAFDRLVEAWSSELGAISYAESLSLMDLILLTGEVDNRAYLEALRLKLDNLDHRLNETEHSRDALDRL